MWNNTCEYKEQDIGNNHYEWYDCSQDAFGINAWTQYDGYSGLESYTYPQTPRVYSDGMLAQP